MMRKMISFIITIISLASLMACDVTPVEFVNSSDMTTKQLKGQIYLYGEVHAVDKILEKEFELWKGYYGDEGMRHLFVELPYYTAEFLNMWMQSDDDDILEEIYGDWMGTQSYAPNVKEFYKKIKNECPETIFHGTDVGHQYDTTGGRFLRYLKKNNLEGSEQYLITLDTIDQGRTFSHPNDAVSGAVYRENMMVENFIREFDKLNGENCMGNYGGAHTGLDAMDITNSIPCMANQLKEHYGDAVHSLDLSWIARDIDPSRIDIITINGKDYEASYFGKQSLLGFIKDYRYREFWRLENAYDDFKNKPKTGNILPCNEYTMLIEVGQVFVIDYKKTDGSNIRAYHRSDGLVFEGVPCTEEFTIE